MNSNWIKKTTVCLLSSAMMLSLSACSSKSAASTASASTADNGDYSKHLSFTVLSIDDNDEFMNWPLVKEAEEKFNFDFNIQQVAYDTWSDSLRTMAATNSLPDVVAWYDLPSFNEYSDWASQGILKAFPEDMSAYPQLQSLMDSHQIFDHLKIDDKLYAFPKINLNDPWYSYDPYYFLYRRDWAEKMGLDYGAVQDMTWDQFVNYLKLVKEKDPGNIGDKLVPLDMDNGGQDWTRFSQLWNQNLGTYKKNDDGKYVWGSDDTSSITAINKLHELYTSGLLEKDSYADSMEMGKERFETGCSAVNFVVNGPGTINETYRSLKKNNPDLKDTDLGIMTVSIDGQYPVNELVDYWGAFAFSGNCSDEIMNRWLAVGNWLLEDDQVKEAAYGVKDQDWTEDDSGQVKLNYTTDETVSGQDKGYISDEQMFQKFYILEGLDALLPNNPNISNYLVEDCLHGALNQFNTAPKLRSIDWDLSFKNGTYLTQYGCLEAPTSTAVIQSVVSDDPAGTWNKFISDNKDTIQLVLDEINQ